MEATKNNAIRYYPPKEDYIAFDNEEDYADKGRGWGLFGKAPKKQFWYKNATTQTQVTIKGYQEFNNLSILVVEFEDGNVTCIHPSFLKEMQSGNFGKEIIVEDADGSVAGEAAISEAEPAKPAKSSAEKPPKAVKAPKKQVEKLDLPLEKVKFSAKVKEFTTKPNPFSDNDDEVVLLEEVAVLGETPLMIGDAWCGYSNTLKGFALEVGDLVEFEGKVVDKKFNKEILYKVNNPSKLTKK